MTDLKLRLIAGTINVYVPEEGWLNVHLDVSPRLIWHPILKRPVQPEFVCDIAETPFPDGQFDEVRCSHVFEHLSASHGEEAAAEVHRILRPGGAFDIETPDLDRIARAWIERTMTTSSLNQWLYGEDLGRGHTDGDTHRCGYNERLLRALLEGVGFEVGEREETGLAVRFVAVKP